MTVIDLLMFILRRQIKQYKHIYQELAYPASKEWENDHSYP